MDYRMVFEGKFILPLTLGASRRLMLPIPENYQTHYLEIGLYPDPDESLSSCYLQSKALNHLWK